MSHFLKTVNRKYLTSLQVQKTFILLNLLGIGSDNITSTYKKRYNVHNINIYLFIDMYVHI